MKLFKVYAQCVRKVRPYQEVCEQELKDAINNELIGDALDSGVIGNCYDEETMEFDENKVDEEIGEFYDKAMKRFEDYGIINCGDFCIIKANDLSEVSRPNVCGYDTSLIMEV